MTLTAAPPQAGVPGVDHRAIEDSGGHTRPGRFWLLRRLLTMGRTLLQRLHNPHNSTCGCDADCWCNRMAVGKAVKWWFPARWFGIEHKDSRRDTMFVGWSKKDIKYWERAQQREAQQRMDTAEAK